MRSGAERPGHRLDDLLDLPPDGGQAPFRQVVQLDLEVGAGREGARRCPRLLPAAPRVPVISTYLTRRPG